MVARVSRERVPWIIGTALLAALLAALAVVRAVVSAPGADRAAPATALAPSAGRSHPAGKASTGRFDTGAAASAADTRHEPEAPTAVEIAPKVDDDAVARAIASFERDRVSARATVDRALAADPGDPSALEARAWMHLRDGEWTTARRRAVECLVRDPQNEGCRRSRALAYTRDGEMGPRLEVMKHCLSAARTEAACLASMAGFHLGRREIAEAKALLGEIAPLDSAGDSTALTEARIAEAEGRALDAKTAYRRACDLGAEQACEKK